MRECVSRQFKQCRGFLSFFSSCVRREVDLASTMKRPITADGHCPAGPRSALTDEHRQPIIRRTSDFIFACTQSCFSFGRVFETLQHRLCLFVRATTLFFFFTNQEAAQRQNLIKKKNPLALLP